MRWRVINTDYDGAIVRDDVVPESRAAALPKEQISK